MESWLAIDIETASTRGTPCARTRNGMPVEAVLPPIGARSMCACGPPHARLPEASPARSTACTPGVPERRQIRLGDMLCAPFGEVLWAGGHPSD